MPPNTPGTTPVSALAILWSHASAWFRMPSSVGSMPSPRRAASARSVSIMLRATPGAAEARRAPSAARRGMAIAALQVTTIASISMTTAAASFRGISRRPGR